MEDYMSEQVDDLALYTYQYGFGRHVSSSLAAASMTTPIVLTNCSLQQITELIERQPLGHYLEFQNVIPTPATQAASDMASKLRNLCFPNQMFHKCALFRGCRPDVLQTHTTVAEGDGYVVMWKHGQGGTVKISSVAWSDFWKEDFDTTQWNIVIYWDHKETSIKEDVPTPTENEPMNTDGVPPYDDPDVPMPPASPSAPEDTPTNDTYMPPVAEEVQQPTSRQETDSHPPPDLSSPDPTRKARKPPSPEGETKPPDKKQKPDEPSRARTEPSSSSSHQPILPIRLDDQGAETDNDDDEEDRGTIAYPEHDQDLIVFDDSTWSSQPEGNKLASQASSFSVITTMEDTTIDVLELSTSPATLQELCHMSSPSLPSEQVLLTEEEKVDDKVRAQLIALDRSLTKFRVSGLAAKATSAKRPDRSRKEATTTEVRQFSKDFAKAKQDEYKSWVDNDVFELVDLRKVKCKNFVRGRWVLTVKRDKDGNFLKCKARWVLQGFLDKQKDDQQTDSPTASRPGFRMACQFAANGNHDLYHVDLRTAFLQGEAYDHLRDIICQLPSEAGHPPYIAARLKRPAYGLNDAPRRWWNIIDKALREYGMVPTRADRCCYVLHSTKATKSKEQVSRERTYERSLDPKDLERAMDYLLDPIYGSPSHGKIVVGVLCLHVDDLFMAGNKEFHHRVIEALKRDFQVGSEDINDIMFVGQRIRWSNKGQTGAYIRVDQDLCIDELQEISVEKNMSDNMACSPQHHTAFRSVLGQINWLQSRTQYPFCYRFSRSASCAAAPTYGDIRTLNKLVRSIKNEPADLRYWPLRGNMRIIGFPDAAYRNNSDSSSQRGQAIFLAEERTQHPHSRGSLIDFESHKINKTTLSTTVAELYSLMKCFGTCQMLRGLWMDISSACADVHLRTDANNLVTTASSTHLPEQKETIHMIQMLRKESCSGSIEDLAHVRTELCLGDCLTKASAKSDALRRSVET